MKDEIIKVEYKEPEFSEGAVEMAGVLMAAGLTGEELLMLPRACGDDVDAWDSYISLSILKGYLKEFDISGLITKESLTSVCQTLKEKGLIKEFDENLKTVNYFLVNFSNDITIIRPEHGMTLPDYWLHQVASRLSYKPDDVPRVYNEKYNLRVKGIPEPYNAAARAYMAEVLPPSQYAEIIGDIYGTPNSRDGSIPWHNYGSFLTWRNLDVLKEAKIKIAPFADEIVRILTIGLVKQNLL